MSRRIVFDVTEEQILRFVRLGEKEKEISIMARKSFEEWLKRRESRSRRAEIQKSQH